MLSRTLRMATVIVLPLLLFFAGSAGLASAQSDDGGVLETGPGEIVVDYAPGTEPADENAEAVLASVDVALAAASSGAASAADEVTIQNATVVYNGDYPSPGNVRTVVESALGNWNANLNIDGPVEIEVFWFPFDQANVLGAAGFLKVFRNGGLPTESFTPGPLANSLLQTDLDPQNPEIQVLLNSNFPDWYISSSGQPPANQIDLYTVVLHELGHGFGFAGSAFSDNGAPPALGAVPYGYDTHVFHGNGRLIDQPDPNSLLTSNNLFFDLPSGERYKLYAPNPWQQGSSYSHFDEATYTGSDPGALMTPRLGRGEALRVLDGPVLGLMEQIGWPTDTGEDPFISGTVRDTGNSPVANVVVDLFAASDPFTRGQWIGDARTDGSGAYRFDVGPGCYILTFIAPAGGSFPASGSQWLNQYVCVQAGQPATGIDVMVSLPGGGSSSIGGTVTGPSGGSVGLVVDRFAANGDGSRAGWLGDASTDGSGVYRFEDVDPGCYVLVFIAPDGFQMVGGNRWLERSACVTGPGQSIVVDAAVVAN